MMIWRMVGKRMTCTNRNTFQVFGPNPCPHRPTYPHHHTPNSCPIIYGQLSGFTGDPRLSSDIKFSFIGLLVAKILRFLGRERSRGP